MDEQIPGMNRSDLKRIKGMPLSEFKCWLLEYTDVIYKQGIADCCDAIHAEFGFGRNRLQRLIERVNRK